ncbi:hypothetical protein [Nonomuraea diastatica]|uniref:Uncharacterized protein n=1 Tax=Nonomuraea diastatica TaxID=1848329 RepID=A0A4R4WF45_9ACTN|nr:hypothetical protein [Nonomuraea diastatica]TDD14065.1 hypothetical protein E1294_38765 [Nonomuraea diastatica]
MKQHHSVQRRRLLSIFSGFTIAATVFTVSTLSDQPAVSAAPLSQETGSAQPTSVYTEFTGWRSWTPQEGWAITHAPGKDLTWKFVDTPFARPPGSDGSFAGIYGTDRPETAVDTSLVSPAVDLTGQESPVIEFDSAYYPYLLTGGVELSLNGGLTWSTAWEGPAATGGTRGRMTVPIPQAAGHLGVLVRFHSSGRANQYGSWSIDNVFIGTR